MAVDRAGAPAEVPDLSPLGTGPGVTVVIPVHEGADPCGSDPFPRVVELVRTRIGPGAPPVAGGASVETVSRVGRGAKGGGSTDEAPRGEVLVGEASADGGPTGEASADGGPADGGPTGDNPKGEGVPAGSAPSEKGEGSLAGHVGVLVCTARRPSGQAAPNMQTLVVPGAGPWELARAGLAVAEGEVVLLARSDAVPDRAEIDGHVRAHLVEHAAVTVGGVTVGAGGRGVGGFFPRAAPPHGSGGTAAPDQGSAAFRNRPAEGGGSPGDGDVPVRQAPVRLSPDRLRDAYPRALSSHRRDMLAAVGASDTCAPEDLLHRMLQFGAVLVPGPGAEPALPDEGDGREGRADGAPVPVPAGTEGGAVPDTSAGASDGAVRAASNGAARGTSTGTADGASNGAVNGTGPGTASGAGNRASSGRTAGTANGVASRSLNGAAHGATSSASNGAARGGRNGAANGVSTGSVNGSSSGASIGASIGATDGAADRAVSSTSNGAAPGTTNGAAGGTVPSAPNGADGGASTGSVNGAASQAQTGAADGSPAGSSDTSAGAASDTPADAAACPENPGEPTAPIRDPGLEHRVPWHPARRARPSRQWEVPYADVVVEASRADADEVHGTVDALLNGLDQDLRLTLVGPWRAPERSTAARLLREVYRYDPRVLLAEHVPAPDPGTPVRLTVPAGVEPAPDALRTLAALADEHGAGALTLPCGTRGALRWERTAALARVRLTGIGPEGVAPPWTARVLDADRVVEQGPPWPSDGRARIQRSRGEAKALRADAERWERRIRALLRGRAMRLLLGRGHRKQARER